MIYESFILLFLDKLEVDGDKRKENRSLPFNNPIIKL